MKNARDDNGVYAIARACRCWENRMYIWFELIAEEVETYLTGVSATSGYKVITAD
jgi:hypothetical protein